MSLPTETNATQPSKHRKPLVLVAIAAVLLLLIIWGF